MAQDIIEKKQQQQHHKLDHGAGVADHVDDIKLS
jgi:hypothetical protein